MVEEVFVERVAVEPREELPQEEPPLPEQDVQAQHGNGAAAEADDSGNGVDSAAARMAGADLAPAEDEVEDDGAREEPKSFARKFVARREARRARKGSGTSLRDRLRGLTAERPDR